MALGDTRELYGNTRVSGFEASIYEPALAAGRYTDIPSNLQMFMDYLLRTDGQPTYIGYGAKGLATSANGWLIYKFTFDDNGFITIRQTAYAAWDNRADGGTTYA